MKKLLISFILINISFFSFGQKSFEQIVINQNLKSTIDSLQFQISFTNYCLEKYRAEKVLGTWLITGGAVVVGIFNIPQLNGMSKAEDDYKHQMALAGDNLDQKIAATNDYRSKTNDIEKRQEVMTIVGGIVFLAGSVLQIDSYKWLKRAYISPASNGIGVKIIF
jgi:hypothetical protein